MSNLPPPSPAQRIPPQTTPEHATLRAILACCQALCAIGAMILITLWVWLLRLVDLAPFVRPVIN